ncbi:MAG: HNH endonuclease signature motif containing protein [Proteobacteria bacterium]|nr:HNH endonuclease signature motif containing protein [Pseudomonadota bacterium]
MFTKTIEDQIAYFENHENVLLGLQGLIETAQRLHREERKISLLSIRLVGLLVEQNGAGNSRMNQEHFAYYIGLTQNQFWKRSQAYRVIKNFPEFGKMIDSGETSASHVAMLSSKITAANAEVLTRGIRQKSTQEVRDFIAAITPEGDLRDDTDTFVDIKLRLCKTQVDLLERAREILAHGGAVPSTADLVIQALEEFVDRRDPLKKAERAEGKSHRKNQFDEEDLGKATALKQSKDEGLNRHVCSDGLLAPALKQDVFQTQRNKQFKIPAGTRHKVWLRDGGYCTYELSPGIICKSRMMLEVDHIVPVARGGLNHLDNLTLKCRHHNQWRAIQMFGEEHMEQFRHLAPRSFKAIAFQDTSQAFPASD